MSARLLRLLLSLAVAAMVAGNAGAQEWRTMEVARQLRDSQPHQLVVRYGAGRLEIHPSNDPLLFRMHLRYNDANGRPLHHYAADTRTLRVGIENHNFRVGGKMSEESSGEMNLGLSRLVPFDLELDAGATRADLELGGLMLTNARINTGAADATLRFSTPNIAKLRSLEVQVGAAAFTARGLANANTSTVRVQGGVGDVSLSFDGSWTQDMALDANVALGKLTIRVPPDVGIQVNLTRVLASFDHPDLVKRGDAFYSANWEAARFKLRIDAQTALGAIEISRTLRP